MFDEWMNAIIIIIIIIIIAVRVVQFNWLLTYLDNCIRFFLYVKIFLYLENASFIYSILLLDLLPINGAPCVLSFCSPLFSPFDLSSAWEDSETASNGDPKFWQEALLSWPSESGLCQLELGTKKPKKLLVDSEMQLFCFFRNCDSSQLVPTEKWTQGWGSSSRERHDVPLPSGVCH